MNTATKTGVGTIILVWLVVSALISRPKPPPPKPIAHAEEPIDESPTTTAFLDEYPKVTEGLEERIDEAVDSLPVDLVLNDDKSDKKDSDTKQEQPVAQVVGHGFLDAMLEENNRVRAQYAHGKPQVLDQRLCQAAQDQANYMASTGKLEHSGANGTPLSRANKYGFQGTVAENAAGDFSTVTNAFNGWLRSTVGHMQTLMSDDYDRCGFGYATGPTGGRWVALYGKEGAQKPPELTFTSQPRVIQYQAPRVCSGPGCRRGLFGRWRN